LLTWYGYVANVEQTATSLLGIRLSMSVFPAALLVAAAILMSIYPLDDRLMVRIEADLKARKDAAASDQQA
jgi:GPH family glycoside/pentoside/hexuronide:cation symporter